MASERRRFEDLIPDSGDIADVPPEELDFHSRFRRAVRALRLLMLLAPPEELDRAADTIEAVVERGMPELESSMTLLRRLAATSRMYVGHVEALGLRWDWDERVMLSPKGGRRGPPKKSHTWLVGFAWEALGGRSLGEGEWYGKDTLAAIRQDLTGLMPPERLTDDKIKATLQRYVSQGGRT